jgi:hypothetical protein
LSPNVTAKSIVPFNNNIPFMSQLIKYYESDDKIYLLTDYYPLGKLYWYLELFYDNPDTFLEDILTNKLITSAILDESDDGKVIERQTSMTMSTSLDNSRIKKINSRRRRSMSCIRLNNSFSSLTSLNSHATRNYKPLKRRTVSTAIGDLQKNTVDFSNMSHEFKLAEVELKNVSLTDETVASATMSPISTSSNSSSSSCLESNDTKEEHDENEDKKVEFSESLAKKSPSFLRPNKPEVKIVTAHFRKASDQDSKPLGNVKPNQEVVSKTNRSSRALKVREWLAQVFCCLNNLHRLGIVCKDLGPENLLLSAKGQVVLTYTSKWNLVDEKVDRDLVMDFYAAPGW